MHSSEQIQNTILMICKSFISQPISKRKIYQELFVSLPIKQYLFEKHFKLLLKKHIFLLEKYNYARSKKIIYFQELKVKNIQNISYEIFKNLIYKAIESNKIECYYVDNIDFYLPEKREIILCKPYTDERRIYQTLFSLEQFIVENKISSIIFLTKNLTINLSYPFSKVQIFSLESWLKQMKNYS